jgi:hypothetical protein
MQASVGLCGRNTCKHICSRVCYCPLGTELSFHRLGLQRERRQLRREQLRAVVGQLETNIRRAAGPFEEFSRRLAWERQRKGGYQ